MFWNKKPKLPITPNDQIWVEESLTFLKDSLGQERLLAIKTVEPTKDFFNREFDGSETDAEFILEQCQKLMDIPEGKIVLEFYSEEAHYLDDGTLLSSSADIMGKSEGAAGTYQKQGGKATIRIERGQLSHPKNLIATIAHELAHEKLLGEHRIIENDEYLTDLTAIAFGFGIFIANTKFQFSSGLQNGFGWQMKSQGYLPEQVIAYAMASLSLKKEESTPNYVNHLEGTVAGYFKKSLKHLQSDTYTKDPKLFWEIQKEGDSVKAYDSAKNVEYKKQFVVPDTLKEWQKEIMQACYFEEVDKVEAMLQKRFSPNFTAIGGSPLTVAVMRNNKNLVDTLLHYFADINYSEHENLMDVLPLMAAVKNENIAMMKYLISLKAKIDCVGGNGKSVLEVAVETKNIDVVDCLLKAGANIEIKSGQFLNFKNSPITAAVSNNDTEMVSYLIKNGAKTKPIRKMIRHEIHPKMVRFLKSKKYL